MKIWRKELYESTVSLFLKERRTFNFSTETLKICDEQFQFACAK